MAVSALLKIELKLKGALCFNYLDMIPECKFSRVG